MQGLVFGPLLFAIFIDSLLQKLSQLSPDLSFVYVDDLKFVKKANGHGCALDQTAVTIINEWSDSMFILLSIEKSMVLHCGAKNVKH